MVKQNHFHIHITHSSHDKRFKPHQIHYQTLKSEPILRLNVKITHKNVRDFSLHFFIYDSNFSFVIHDSQNILYMIRDLLFESNDSFNFIYLWFVIRIVLKLILIVHIQGVLRIGPSLFFDHKVRSSQDKNGSLSNIQGLFLFG